MEQTTPRRRLFYGYIIVLSSLLILTVMQGINSSFGVFLSPLQNQFGCDRATISGAGSLAFLFMAVFSAVSGWLTDRVGPRVTMSLSAAFLATGLLLAARSSAIWQFYLAYGVLYGVGLSSGDVALLPTVARWFVKRRSFMSSLAKVGTGLGMFLMPLIASWLILTFNWRVAYTVLALAALIIVIALSQLLRRDPTTMGLRPYGESDVGPVSTLNKVNLNFRQTVKTWQFWLICGSYFLLWYTTQSILVHITAHSMTVGLSAARAAGVVSTIGAASIAGRLAMGGTGDRIGNRWAVSICQVVLLTALVWLQFAQQTWMLYVFGIVYGFAHGGMFSIVSPFLAETFGTKAHGSNMGMLFFIGQIGGAAGPIITGRLYDINQNYHLAFLILIFVVVTSISLLLAIRPVKTP